MMGRTPLPGRLNHSDQGRVTLGGYRGLRSRVRTGS
jgi:hypothetical protein